MSLSAEEGTVRVPSFELPMSQLLDEQTREELRRQSAQREALARLCPRPGNGWVNPQEIIAARECYARHREARLAARHRELFPVEIEARVIEGVPVEVVTPAAGTPPENAHRVLINVHGGGFIFGRPWVGQMEAVPVAATAGIRVVTVDYRMAPEHEFPAASEDVAKVYRHLLGQYAPGNIGIYGCSAGAVLTSQSVVWIEKEGLPRPGAVAMLGAAGGYWGEGDAGHFCAARSGIPLAELADPCRNPYFRNADPADPLVFPMRSRAHLARFPASLLVAATRDLALSSVVHMHCLLVALGVPADLHVWEGLDHAFHYWPDLPQSREVYQVIARFFDRHLR